MVHANRINADAFDEVAKAMQDRGYVFISIDEAMKDPAYARPDSFDGEVGVTWLSRWSAEQGKKLDYGIKVPEFVLEASRLSEGPVQNKTDLNFPAFHVLKRLLSDAYFFTAKYPNKGSYVIGLITF